MKRTILAACMAALSLPVAAETFRDYPDLPPLAAVEQALKNTAMARTAQAGMGVASASRDQLRAGHYEIGVRVGAQQRRVKIPSEQFAEWDVGLERALRLPGKARIDNQLGAQGMTQAGFAYGDALHESGRMLLKAWFVWLREVNQQQQWQTQVGLLREQLGIVDKRIKAGDAARLEQLQVQAALSQAVAQLTQAQLRVATAANELNLRYPAIVLPTNPVLPQPEPVTEGLDFWLGRALEHNHELALAHGEAERSRLQLSRSEADRVPDPTLGVRFASERGGEDHIIGVNLMIPLPGAARKANQAGALASSAVASEREAGVLTKIKTETTSSWLTTQSAYSAWQAGEQAAAAMRNSTDLMARAYQLGESGLSDVLTARRQMQDAQLGAINARLDVAEARYRLLLDTHQLWPIDADEAGHAPVNP
jgi:cobalt-zinc-cadmium efflux system outer membrane protein